MARLLPMFPLGNPTFPYTLLPLHIFEERYRALITDVMAMEDPEFGVVLIERGWEVGGGDERFSVGTLVKVLRAEELADGRWVTVTAGVRRLRVVEWLADDPYPRAQVVDLEDAAPGPESDELRTQAAGRIQRTAALRAELGDPTPPLTIELAADPVAACYQACAAAGLGPLDGQRMLETDDLDTRYRDLLELLDENLQTLEQRLALG